MAAKNFESEINLLLGQILKNEDIKDFSLNIIGNSGSGDGYMGDIVFAQATGTAPNGSEKTYDFVLKCSKGSEASKKDSRFKESFVNEIFIYDKLFPKFEQFQKERGVEGICCSTPKCYGTLDDGNIQIIALGDLKESGFEMWPRKAALTRNHIDLVMREYGRFHAISAAMAYLQPEAYKQIADKLYSNLKSFYNLDNDVIPMYEACILDIGNVLKDDLDEDTLIKWKKLGKDVGSVIRSFIKFQGYEVIIHADCWNNNFMFKYESNDKTTPSQVSILDWQMPRSCSPICDLSYLLFTCISKDDIEHLDSMVDSYYEYFSDHLKKLGIDDPNLVYSFKQFREDWIRFGKFGIIMASLIVKLCAINETDIATAAESKENEKGFGASFMQDFQDKEAFKNRIQHVVEYGAKNGLF